MIPQRSVKRTGKANSHLGDRLSAFILHKRRKKNKTYLPTPFRGNGFFVPPGLCAAREPFSPGGA
jgi:hypothetical protein